MNQIGVNIANMNTTSYKEVETHYQTQLSNVKGNFDFFSVQPSDLRRVDVQGIVTATGKANDLALNGQGFFITNAEPDGTGTSYYTRDGGFSGRAFDTGQDVDGDGLNDQSTYMVSAAGHYLMGWAADDSGGFSATMSAVHFSHAAHDPARATAAVTIRGNVPNPNGTPGVHQVTVPVISTGTTDGQPTSAAHNLPLVWTPSPEENNTWTVSIPNSSEIASATVSPAEVVFRADGTIDPQSGVRSLEVTVNWADGSDPSTLSIDISDLTQYSEEGGFRLDSVEQDGYLEGMLNDTFWDAQGVLYGNFSNGTTRALYKLPVATFPAPNQLEALNGNTYRPTEQSGDVEVHSLENMLSVASIEPGALEQSNVVLEDQFTRMITTQKAYSMAATAFRTADEMIQTVGTLKT